MAMDVTKATALTSLVFFTTVNPFAKATALIKIVVRARLKAVPNATAMA